MIDWSLPVRTKGHGHTGRLLDGRGPSERRRVLLPCIRPDINKKIEGTVYLYREDGVCRCDGDAGPYDLENFEAFA